MNIKRLKVGGLVAIGLAVQMQLAQAEVEQVAASRSTAVVAYDDSASSPNHRARPLSTDLSVVDAAE